MRIPMLVTLSLCALLLSACTHHSTYSRGTENATTATPKPKARRVAYAKKARRRRMPVAKRRTPLRAPDKVSATQSTRSTDSSNGQPANVGNRVNFVKNCLDQRGMTRAVCDDLFAREHQRGG